VKYPQFRKYKNSASYFKIYSPERFDEIKRTGDNYELHEFTARILPDRNFIHDITFGDYCEVIEEKEYLQMMQHVNL
jgi:hypothetical protein